MATDAAPVSRLKATFSVARNNHLYAGTAERRIARQFAIFIGLGYLAYLFITSTYIVNATAVSASWWWITATPLVFGSGIAVAIAGLRGSLRGIDATTNVAVIVFAVAVLLWPVAWNGNLIDDSHGMWFLQFDALPALACAMIWRPIWVMAYVSIVITTCSIDNYLVRTPESGNPLIADIVFNVGFCLIPICAALMGMRTARVLDETRDETFRVAGEAAMARAVETERNRFNALTHDGVMATLLAAARQGNSATTTVQARTTLAQIAQWGSDETDLRFDANSVVAQIRAAITEIDQSILVGVIDDHAASATYPADAARALTGATAEAIRNTVRHAPDASKRTVHVTTTPNSLIAVVTDNGPGFDPGGVREHRMGIAVSIRARMAAVDGGFAAIVSTPGDGTSVTVSWIAP